MLYTASIAICCALQFGNDSDVHMLVNMGGWGMPDLGNIMETFVEGEFWATTEGLPCSQGLRNLPVRCLAIPQFAGVSRQNHLKSNAVGCPSSYLLLPPCDRIKTLLSRCPSGRGEDHSANGSGANLQVCFLSKGTLSHDCSNKQ